MNSQEALLPKYIFGPVPSRRLGRSLGIDLVPRKTCTYNCIYCQLGRTTQQTIDRQSYIPIDQAICELEQALANLSAPPDYITLSGSGEPTLHSEIGRIIREAKKRSQIPVAVLTNGSLFHLESVRDALAAADLVIPSLDAADPILFQFINRPHPSLHFEQILRGLKAFRKEFPGAIWLEVMLCAGFNDELKEIRKVRNLIEEIAPDKIQLNTPVRPPAEDYVHPLTPERLDQIVKFFGGRAEGLPTECPSPAPVKNETPEPEILAMLSRRPCSVEDLTAAFGTPPEALRACLMALQRKGLIQYAVFNHRVFYRAERAKNKDSLTEGR